MATLVINSGSSTLKVAIFDEKLTELWSGTLEWSSGQSYDKQIVAYIAPLMKKFAPIGVVGHRVVHGGEIFTKPTVITKNVEKAIGELSILAPLHNPLNLMGIKAVNKIAPNIPQVAVFDTSFHHTLPEPVKTYPVPSDWRKLGIQKYGFHGISHKYCAEKAALMVGKQLKSLKIVSCHLGNGCSMAAVNSGKSVNTTMGFTPLEGLMMGTRSGSIDPEILLFLQREQKLKPEKIGEILNHSCGLKGIAGTEDMRTLLERAKKRDVKAVLAIEMFVERLRQYVGAMIVSMGGMDVLAFTGGIGEHAKLIRSELCKSLQFMDVELDARLNNSMNEEGIISSKRSKVHVVVVHAREELAIAQACKKMKL